MKNFIKWFGGQGMIFQIGLIIIVLAGLVAAFKTVEGIVTHGTDVAVTQAAEAGAAGAVAAGVQEALNNVAKANAAEAEFKRMQALNAGRSCAAYDECMHSNRNGPSACVRFLPYRQGVEFVDCAGTGR